MSRKKVWIIVATVMVLIALAVGVRIVYLYQRATTPALGLYAIPPTVQLSISVKFKPGITEAQAMAVLAKYGITTSSTNFWHISTSTPPSFTFTVQGEQSFSSITAGLKAEPTVDSIN